MSGKDLKYLHLDDLEIFSQKWFIDFCDEFQVQPYIACNVDQNLFSVMLSIRVSTGELEDFVIAERLVHQRFTSPEYRTVEVKAEGFPTVKEALDNLKAKLILLRGFQNERSAELSVDDLPGHTHDALQYAFRIPRKEPNLWRK